MPCPRFLCLKCHHFSWQKRAKKVTSSLGQRHRLGLPPKTGGGVAPKSPCAPINKRPMVDGEMFPETNPKDLKIMN